MDILVGELLTRQRVIGELGFGVSSTHRPPGQTIWSKALVRHGADLRPALAKVLGLTAEDIHAKDGAAASEPSANTAPAIRPTITPSPS